MISFACPNCHKHYQVREELAGKAAKCKSCGHVLRVPAADASPPVAQAPPPARPASLADASGFQYGATAPSTVSPQHYVSQSPPHDPSRWPPQMNPPQVVPPQARQPIRASSPAVSHSYAPPVSHAPSPNQYAPQPVGPSVGGEARVSVRLKRLKAEALQVQKAFASCGHIRIFSMQGDPPERYLIEYRVRGLARGPAGPVFRDEHLAEIQLTSEYPRQSPKCKMLTPIFHPNFEPATICVGDHWTAGERLVDLIVRIAEMITFQAYNIKSPLDGEAAMWADQHRQHLPTDGRDMRPADLG
jgi:ubiquitin-protein ligase